MVCVCDLCGWMWIPSVKLEGLPKRCSKCKSMRWNSGASGRAPKVGEVKSQPKVEDIVVGPRNDPAVDSEREALLVYDETQLTDEDLEEMNGE
jgi:hypothetical protein